MYMYVDDDDNYCNSDMYYKRIRIAQVNYHTSFVHTIMSLSVRAYANRVTIYGFPSTSIGNRRRHGSLFTFSFPPPLPVRFPTRGDEETFFPRYVLPNFYRISIRISYTRTYVHDNSHYNIGPIISHYPRKSGNKLHVGIRVCYCVPTSCARTYCNYCI